MFFSTQQEGETRLDKKVRKSARVNRCIHICMHTHTQTHTHTHTKIYIYIYIYIYKIQSQVIFEQYIKYPPSPSIRAGPRSCGGQGREAACLLNWGGRGVSAQLSPAQWGTGWPLHDISITNSVSHVLQCRMVGVKHFIAQKRGR